MRIKNIPLLALGMAMLGTITVLITFSVAMANPSVFPAPIKSTAATTTPYAYLGVTGNASPVAAQATTTAINVYNSTANPSSSNFDKNYLMVQMAASSTSSRLNVRFQFSTDGIDWYDDNLTATSSPTNDIRTPRSFDWYAQVTATTSKIIEVPTATSYVRAVFTSYTASSTIWYQWGPTRQAN